MAVCEEEGQYGVPSRRWRRLWLEGGTTVEVMYEFFYEILEDIGVATPENWFCFTMDNLNAHKNEGVIALIHAYGHGVSFRAPYYPVDGSIEFIFNTLQVLIRSNLYEVNDAETLIQVIQHSIQSMIDFSTYFHHVGFIHD